MRKRKQFHNIIENVIYFKIPNYRCSPPLKLQLLSSTSPNNDNCSPSAPLPIHNCSPSPPPLPNYNFSPSPPCLGTSFVPRTARMISQYGPITSTDLTLDIGKLK